MTKKKAYTKQEISLDTVIHVARLSRLDLTKAEARKYQNELNGILAAFGELKKIRTNAKPSFHPLEVKDVTRKDEIEESFYQEKALANTKHREKGFFRGPRAV
jgi:aspartyl-tRNA(Asn)/glutamyl-tRNA(Gln) amidotransferase subunit C